MLLAISLLSLHGAAQPPVPDLFRPDPSLRFLDSRGQLLPEEAKRIPLAVEAIDTFELRVRALSPLEAIQRAQTIARDPDDNPHGSNGVFARDARTWPYRIRMTRPRDSLTRWTAWLDLERPSKLFPGSFLEVAVIAGPQAYRPTTKDANCDSTWAKSTVLVTDLGVVAHGEGSDSLEIQTLDLARIRPWGNISLERILPRPAKFRSDSLGRLRIPSPTDSDSSEVWVASTGGEPARIALLDFGQNGRTDDPWHQSRSTKFLGGNAGNQTYPDGQRVFPYVFRSSHRPGDTLVVGCLARGPGGAPPKGKSVKLRISRWRNSIDSAVVPLDGSGHAQWRWTLPARIPSGYYRIGADLSGSVGTASFSVEETKIPRLQVELSEDTSARKTKGVRWGVKARWSTGTSAGGLPVEVHLECTGSRIRGDRYTSLPEGWEENRLAMWDTLLTGTLDAAGRFSVPKLKPPRSATGDAGWCDVVGSVFEDGGHPTTSKRGDRFDSWYAGPGLRTGTDDTLLHLQAAWIDERDSLVRKVPLRIRILWDGRELASKNVASGESWKLPASAIARKLDDPTHSYALDAVVCARDGKTCIHQTLNLEPDWRNELRWGYRYRAHEEEDPEKQPDTLPHPDLSPRIVREGDSVQVRWEASQPGLAWVRVIQGNRTLAREFRPVKTGTNVWKAPSDSTWTPGVHVVVMELAHRADSLPWVRVAGLRVQVDRRTDSFPLRILTDSVLKPGGIARVSLVNPTARKGTFVLSAIDQGILDLTHFQMADPADFFARPEKGRFDWWYGCGSRHEPYASEQWANCSTEPSLFGESRMNGRSGFGSGSGGRRGHTLAHVAGGPGGPPRSLAKPFSWISGILPLPANRMDLDIPVPSFLGLARIQVVAASGRDIRLVDTQVVSRSNLELIATLPQILAPADTTMALVKVHGRPNQAGTLRTKAWDGIRALDTTPLPLVFDASGWALARVPLAAQTNPGEGFLECEARQGPDVQSMTSRMEIRDDRNLSSDIVNGAGEAGKVRLALPRRYADSAPESRLEVATRGILGLDRRIQDLLRYPHGCLEQIVSGAFPQLLLEDLAPTSTPAQSEAARSHVGEVMARLPRLATSDGLLSLWPGQTESDPFASLWAARFLQEAALRDVQGGSTLLRKLSTSLASVRFPDPVEDLQRLAFLPTFAERYQGGLDADSAQLDSLDALPLSGEARWILASAWERRGRHDRALVQAAKAKATSPALARAGRQGRASRLRDQAWALEAMYTLSDRVARDSLLGLLTRDLAGNHWLSTQEQGALLVALAKTQKVQEPDAADTILWRAPGGPWTRFGLVDGRGGLEIPGNLDSIEVRSLGGTKLLQAQVHRRGTLKTPESLRDSGLAVQVRFLSGSGSVLEGRLRERDAFAMEIRTTNTSGQDLTNIAATASLPGGWAIRREDLAQRIAGTRFQDARADRIVYHFDLARAGELVLRIPLRATQEGSYRGPEVSVEALYDNALRAKWRGERARIAP